MCKMFTFYLFVAQLFEVSYYTVLVLWWPDTSVLLHVFILLPSQFSYAFIFFKIMTGSVIHLHCMCFDTGASRRRRHTHIGCAHTQRKVSDTKYLYSSALCWTSLCIMAHVEDVGTTVVSVISSEDNEGVSPSCDWLHWDQLHVDGYSFKNARRTFTWTACCICFECRSSGRTRRK